MKGTGAAAISVVGLSFFGLLDFGQSSTIGCPRQGANCCYIDNVKLLQDLIKNVS